MKPLFYLLFILSAHTLLGQKNKEEIQKVTLSKGSIALNDGQTLRGQLYYEDRTGILTFKDDGGSHPYMARTVAAFEYFDEDEKKQRIFYSFPYEDTEHSAERPQFFELLRELPTFSVFRKLDRLETVQKSGAGGPGHPAPITMYSVQTETIYIMDKNNVLHPYTKALLTHESLASSEDEEEANRSKKKMIDRDLLSSFITKPLYDKLKLYAKQERLSFKRKNDFLKILDYYKTLVN